MIDNKFYRAGTAALLTMAFSSHSAVAATDRQLDAHDHGHAQVNMAIFGQEVQAELITPAANVVGFEYMPRSDEDKMAVAKAVEQLTRGEQLFLFSTAAECSLLSAEIESALIADEHDHDDDDHHDDEAHGEHDDEHHDDEKHDDHGDEHHDDEKHDDHDDDHHDDEAHDEHDDEHHDDEHHDDEHHDDEKHDDHDDEHHDDDAHGEHDDDHHDDEKHDGHDEKHDDHDGHDDDHDAHSEFHVTWSFSCANPDELSSVQVMLFEAFTGFEEVDVSVAAESGQSAHELTDAKSEISL